MKFFLISSLIAISFVLTQTQTVIGFLQAEPLERIAAAVSKSKDSSDARDRAVEALLFEFVRANKVDLVEQLIEEDGKVDFLNPQQNSLLHVAAANGTDDLVKFFLDRGLDANATNLMDHCPIHLAIASNEPNNIKLLLENGAQVNSEKGTVSPLGVAVSYGHFELAKLLIDKGADLKHQDEKGNTPLHLAIDASNLAITELLMQSLPKLDIKNNAGLTPFGLAKKYMSNLDSIEEKRRWGVEQVVGPPDAGTGDDPLAWAPGNTDKREWLIVHFDKKVMPDKVQIFECNSVGAVRKITVFDYDGKEKLAWIGRDPVKTKGEHKVALIDLDTKVKTNKIKIYLAGDEYESWNEIDAVGLIDAEDNKQWAVWADASSCYAGNVSPFNAQRAIYRLLDQQEEANE